MDKAQKLREMVEKRYEYWREKESNSHSIESEIRMSECQHLLLMLNSLQEEPVSVWHNVQYPYDETKPVLIVAIDHTLHLWKGKFDTDKMCNAFKLSTGTDRNNKPSSIVSKWAYIDDLLKF